jgi:peptide/nickel transport system substrate-binding protein
MRHLRPVILFAILTVVAAGCHETGSPSKEQSAYPAGATPNGPAARVEVLRLAGGDYGSPSPFGYSRGPGYCRMSFLFDTLLWKDASGNVIPWLAESWQQADNGLTWIFTLRNGVKWHDGQPLTVDDVVFSYQYLSRNNWSPTLPDILGNVEKVDERTVRLTLKRPYAPFVTNILDAAPIIPKHIWEKVEDPKKFTDSTAWIGSGPYLLKSYSKADGSYLYEANDNFWLGPPYVKRIELIPVGDEALSLKQGQIDAGSIASVTSATSKELMKVFTDNPKYAVITAPGEWNLILNFNLTKGEPFTDKAFRQAVAYGLDLQKMVDQVLFGAGQPGNPGYLPPSNQWQNPKAKTYPYDPVRARQLLKSAGYIDRNGDGVLETPDGRSLKLQLVYSGDLSSPRPAEMIKSWLADIGIDISLKAVDTASLDQITAAGQYEMAITGYGGMGADPDNMRTTFSSQSKSTSFGRVFGYQNARFDELAAKQFETSDEQARRAMIYEMQEILADDVPAIPLYYPDRNLIYDKTVFDAWYFTPGGVGSGVPTAWNKQAFITGQKTGLQIKGR